MNTRFDPELSRLAFEERMVEIIEDGSLPLLERVRLLAILAERLDVFFMTRVGRLKQLAAEGEQKRAILTPDEQLGLIAAEGKQLQERVERVLSEVLGLLEERNITIADWKSLDNADREYLQRICGSQLTGLIKPIIVDANHTFVHVRNLRPALVAEARHKGGERCLVVIELPADLPRLVQLGRAHRFVPLEQIVAAELPSLCTNLEIGTPYLFRVTRSAYTELDDDDDVLRDFEQEIVRRPFQDVIRLEVDAAMPRALQERLRRELQDKDNAELMLRDGDVYEVEGLLDLTALEIVAKIDLSDLKSEPIKRRDTRVDNVLESATHDALLHFPFDDYDTSIGQFLKDAARHPQLESLQTTIYRTDARSDVVAALREACRRGAEVKAVVELKASFDERENIELARSLEADGIRVVLSPPGLKVHAKTALVTFKEGHTPRRAALVGTGNMNGQTAKAYLDFWLVTRDPGITGDLAALFDVITGEKSPGETRFDHILASPFEMRARFLKLIERETQHALAGRPSGIRVMVNGLSDPTTIAALYRASQAGVPIEMMVRGVCLLRPGEQGISENVRIVTLAGQLLQHARIFHFTNGGDEVWYIGSADWRPRNFDVRVEVIAPVRQPDHIAQLDRVLTDTLASPEAWVLQADGVYTRRETAFSERR